MARSRFTMPAYSNGTAKAGVAIEEAEDMAEVSLIDLQMEEPDFAEEDQDLLELSPFGSKETIEAVRVNEDLHAQQKQEVQELLHRETSRDYTGATRH